MEERDEAERQTGISALRGLPEPTQWMDQFWSGSIKLTGQTIMNDSGLERQACTALHSLAKPRNGNASPVSSEPARIERRVRLFAILLLVSLLVPFNCVASAHNPAGEEISPEMMIEAGMPQEREIKTHVSIRSTDLTITFGPIDLPAPHAGDFAASMPKHYFVLPEDIAVGGFTSTITTEDGTPLPHSYLHHLLLINTDKESLSCPGEPHIVAGTGLEMANAQFPPGYGVRLKRGTHLMAVAAFYHDVPPTKGVVATLTLQLRQRGMNLSPLDAYHIGVNVGCYTQLNQRAVDETDEGIALTDGVFFRSRSFSFSREGCVKFAYPHGHDYLVAIVLDNKTRGQTLLRTTPRVSSQGQLLSFAEHQIYRDSAGFTINTEDTYQLTMVYHTPLHEHAIHYGMANYILYFEPGACPTSHAADGTPLVAIRD